MIDNEFFKASKAFLESFTMDESGYMSQGGHGGLITRETIRLANEFRRQVLIEENRRKVARITEHKDKLTDDE
jgi:hypothetical protein